MANFDLQQSAPTIQELLNSIPDKATKEELEQLRELYEALTQSEIIPVPSADWPVSDPQKNVIYRVAGDESYTDYMWNGTSFIPMATYDNAIDDVPTAGSDNLVKSGGVNGMFGFVGHEFFMSGSDLTKLEGLEISDISFEGIVPSTANHLYFSFFGKSENTYVLEIMQNDPLTVAASNVMSRIDIPYSSIASIEGYQTFVLNAYASNGFKTTMTVNVSQLKKLSNMIATDKLELDIEKCYKRNNWKNKVFTKESLDYEIEKLPVVYDIQLTDKYKDYEHLYLAYCGKNGNNITLYLSTNKTQQTSGIVAYYNEAISNIGNGIAWIQLDTYNNSGLYGRMLVDLTALKQMTEFLILYNVEINKDLLEVNHCNFTNNSILIGVQNFVDDADIAILDGIEIKDVVLSGVIPATANHLYLSFIGALSPGLMMYIMQNDPVNISPENLICSYFIPVEDIATAGTGFKVIKLSQYQNSGLEAYAYVNMDSFKYHKQIITSSLELNLRNVYNRPVLYGKSAVTFGDSITEYDGRTYNWGKEEGIVAKGYQSYMRECGMTVDNQGQSGWTMPQISAKIKQYTEFASKDIVTITSGANDTRKSVPVGVVTDVGSTYNETTYIGALQAALDYILNINPKIKIVLMTPIQGWIYPDGYEPVRQTGGMVSVNYANAIKAVGEKYSIPVLDWYGEAGFNLFTRNIMMNDPEPPENIYYSLHPSRYGFKRMADLLISFLKKIIY